MERFFITFEDYQKNREEGIKKAKQVGWLTSRTTFGGLSGDYMTWTKVELWLKKYYPDHKFDIVEVGLDHITGQLTINGTPLGTLMLSLETFITKEYTNKKTGQIVPEKITKEKAEQLQMRVFVKLVANITGFGLHLWDRLPSFIKKEEPKKVVEEVSVTIEESKNIVSVTTPSKKTLDGSITAKEFEFTTIPKSIVEKIRDCNLEKLNIVFTNWTNQKKESSILDELELYIELVRREQDNE